MDILEIKTHNKDDGESGYYSLTINYAEDINGKFVTFTSHIDGELIHDETVYFTEDESSFVAELSKISLIPSDIINMIKDVMISRMEEEMIKNVNAMLGEQPYDT